MILLSIYLGFVGYFLFRHYSLVEEPLTHFIVGILVTLTGIFFVFSFFAALI